MILETIIALYSHSFKFDYKLYAEERKVIQPKKSRTLLDDVEQHLNGLYSKVH